MHPQARSRSLKSVCATLSALFLAGWGIDDTPQSFLAPKGHVAHIQLELFMQSLGLMTAIFVAVAAVLLYILWRFRARPGDDLPKQNPGNRTLEIVWTLIPVLLILYIAVPTVQKTFYLAQPPKGSRPLQVRVTGNQFWWRFEYPDLGIVTANELHIPAERVVNLTLTSNDVIHSFWVPRLAGKKDLNPGKTNSLWLRAEEEGVYLGQCAEFCGTSHANMRLRVIAEGADEFSAWVAKMQEAASPSGRAAATNEDLPPGSTALRGLNSLSEQTAENVSLTTNESGREHERTDLERRGRELFASRACAACHTLTDVGATGELGPNLNNYALRATLAAGILENTPENVARWIRDPQAIKPAVLMPKVPLSEDEIEAITAYLLSLK